MFILESAILGECRAGQTQRMREAHLPEERQPVPLTSSKSRRAPFDGTIHSEESRPINRAGEKGMAA